MPRSQGSQPQSSQVSPHQQQDSCSTSDLVRDRNLFDNWAKSVKLDPEIREANLPQKLCDIRKDISIVPSWLTNKDAKQFDLHRHLYASTIGALASGSALTCTMLTDDATLSNDVQSALPHIFSIISYNRSLARRVPRPIEAARRLKIDALLSHAWDFPDDRYVYILEGTLQLPKASPQVYTVKPDAMVLFPLDADIQEIISDIDHIGKACTSIISPEIIGHGILHWVIEYKRERDMPISTRQVLVGLVSGLYQRRALGFLGHFLFGIIHYSGTIIDVIAATWAPEDTSEVKPEEDKVDMGAGKHKTQDVQQVEIEIQKKVDANVLVSGKQVEQTDDSKVAGPKIVVYRLGTFKISNSTEMLRLYLLMRSTRKLAEEYKRDIITLSHNRIKERQVSDDSFQWPPVPPAPQNPSSGKGKKRHLPKVPEEEEGEALDELVMTCSSTDWESESSSGAESGVSGPLSPGKLSFTNLAMRIEQLGPGPGTTVEHFLEKLPADGFDPIDIEMSHS